MKIHERRDKIWDRFLFVFGHSGKAERDRFGEAKEPLPCSEVTGPTLP